MTFLNVWTQELPFFEVRNEAKVASNFRKGFRPERPATSISLSFGTEEQLWTLLSNMWAQEPLSRPSSETVYLELERILTLPTS